MNKVMSVYNGRARTDRLGPCALLLGTALASLPGAIAWGQTAPASPAPSTASGGDASGPARIADIVVTANKRRENIQRVPITISSLTADTLAHAGVTSTLDIGMKVPGLTMSSSFDGLLPHIRGIGTPPAAAGDESAVATYLDGVYIAAMGGAMLQLNDISQVDVLKGPQGTLFGRNATGGVIDVRTKDPTQAFHADVSASYGSYGTTSGALYVTGGLNDMVAADLSAYGLHQATGYGVNLFTGRQIERTEEYSLRSKWLITPNDRLTIRLSGDTSRTNDGGMVAYHLDAGSSINIPGGAPYTATTANPYDIDNPKDPRFVFQQSGLSSTIEQVTGFAKITSITAYRDSYKVTSWGTVPGPLTPEPEAAGWTEKGWQASQELQLASLPSSPISWVTGVFYLHHKIGYQPFSITGASLAPLQELSWRDYETTDAGALYGQATAPLFSSDTHITVGVRYSVERKAVVGEETLAFLPGSGIPISVIPTDAGKTFQKPTFRLALDHQFTPNLFGYASFNTGFKSGVYATLPPGGPGAKPVNPETVNAYEAGFKSDLLGHRLRLNGAAYLYDYTQIQVEVNTSSSAMLENGASAKIYGVDLDINARLTSRLSFDLSGAYVHDRFTNFPSGATTTLVPIALGGGRVAGSANLAGKRLPYTPDYTVSFDANYVQPIGEDSLTLNADYAYNDGWYFGADNSDLRQKAYALLNSEATYHIAKTGLDLSVWGKNLTNVAYTTFFASANGGYSYGARLLASPRTYGVTARYHF